MQPYKYICDRFGIILQTHTVEPLSKDTEILTHFLSPNAVLPYFNLRNEDTSLIGKLSSVPMVFMLEGFHCTVVHGS